MVREEKATYSIKGKLTAAIAMLLVAVIMVVSSTYAWFTLSTAPEVTGISTAVGANGALEMMLYRNPSQNGVTAYDNDVNTTWGNLVNLGNNTLYGSDKITLYPSVLNLGGGQLNLKSMLSTPVYGSDGRMSGLSNNTVTGTLVGTSFTENDGYGFRAVGVASGMSDRQLAYRDALSAITVNQNAAQTEARRSLEEKGTDLANIVVNKGVNGNNAKFKQADIDALDAMIAKLDAALTYADKAYVEIVIAFIASKASGLSDEEVSVAVAAIEAAVEAADTATTPVAGDRVNAALNSITVESAKTAVTDILNAYGYTDVFVKAVGDVTDAKTERANITTADEYSWTQIRAIVTSILEVDQVKINDYAASDVMNHKNEIASAVTSGKGLNVYMPSGSGVYADIADLCGNYNADVEILSDNLNVGVDGLTIKAKMQTQAATDRIYFKKAKDTLNNKETYEPVKEEGSDQPLSEFYGYVLDLAFRTNAANSNLLLQDDGIDRIYDDQTTNESTLGGGSYMVFQSSVPSFTIEQVKGLMENIRIVFFDTVGESDFADIYAYAKLDVNAGELTADGWKAPMYIYKSVDNAYNYTVGTGDTATTTLVYAKTETTGEGTSQVTTTTYWLDEDFTQAATVDLTEGNGNTLSKVTEIRSEDNVITSLTQNLETKISALVYLDGASIENADVAATAASSMTGTANFQFASDAELVPMEYANLHPEAQGNTGTDEGTGN